MSRPFGIDCSCSSLKFCTMRVAVVSITGEAPLTVTVSCSVASASSTFTLAVKPERDGDARALQRVEAGELEGQFVLARRDRRKAVVAGFGCDRRLRAERRRTGGRDRDAGQHRALRIRNATLNGAGAACAAALCECRCAQETATASNAKTADAKRLMLNPPCGSSIQRRNERKDKRETGTRYRHVGTITQLRAVWNAIHDRAELPRFVSSSSKKERGRRRSATHPNDSPTGVELDRHGVPRWEVVPSGMLRRDVVPTSALPPVRNALEDEAEADPRRARREDRRRLQVAQASRAADRLRRVAVGQVERIEIRAQADARCRT